MIELIAKAVFLIFSFCFTDILLRKKGISTYISHITSAYLTTFLYLCLIVFSVLDPFDHHLRFSMATSSIIFLIIILIIRYRIKTLDTISILIEEKWDKYVYFLLSFLMLAFMILYSTKQSLWGDELFQIGIISNSNSVSDLLEKYTYSDATGPLFAVFGYLWYRIVPYGEQWLLLLPELFLVLSAYIMGLIGFQIKGRYFGILSTIITITSYSAICFCGYEFRPYALLVLCATVSFYIWILRNKNPNKSWKYILIFAACICLLPLTHYLSIIVCMAYFLVDVFLYVRKKISFLYLLSYIIAGITFLPWAYFRYEGIKEVTNGSGVLVYWQGMSPSFSSFNETIKYLTGYDNFIFILFFIGTAYIFSFLFSQSSKVALYGSANNNMLKIYLIDIYVTIFFIPAFMFIVMFVYPSISSMNSSYIVGRYFFVILPFVIFTAALSVDYVTSVLSSCIKEKIRIKGIFCILIILSVGLTSAISVEDWVSGESTEKVQYAYNHVPYRSGANLLMSEKDIFKKDVVIAIGLGGSTYDGIVEYYFSKKGSRKTPNIISINVSEMTKYRVIYFFSPAIQYVLPEETQKFFDENYELEFKDEKNNIYKYVKI